MIGQIPLPVKVHYHSGKFHLLVTIGLTKNQDMAAHLMIDLPPSLTVGRRTSRSYACNGSVCEPPTKPLGDVFFKILIY
ncbi:hypothetical protein TNCV_324871 [Trichonephila clavipes]|nr:hypothetical protein TNCV_324871 [Trichonephila clavipes]